MCTVTFVPARDGFTITHNRDEAPSRSLFTIEGKRSARRTTLMFPRDAKAGGTWFVCADDGSCACLLNGAFIRHRHDPPYRRSRGLMLLDFFDVDSPEAFFEAYPLEGIEPFTFLYFHKKRITEFRWDGERRYRKELAPDQAHFWCSATLYPPEMQELREAVFRRAAPYHPKRILELHLTGSVGDPANDYVMNRAGRVQTVSITQVVLRKKIARMRYFDLLEGNKDERLLSLKDR